MKAVAIAVMFSGYVLLVYGLNHIQKGCLGFKALAWPSGGTPADPCAGLSPTSASGGTASTSALSNLSQSATTAASGAAAVGYAGTGGVRPSALPGAGTNGGQGISG